MKRLLSILILSLPLILCAQTSKKYPSLLWKISGNGLKKPSYLYGTMHVSNRVAYHLSEQFFEALKSVDVVGLETNPAEWMENMDKTGELGQQNQFTDPYHIGKDFYKSTFGVNLPDKRLIQGLLSYDPDIINGLLYRHNRSRENFEENTYIDLFIFQTASKLNKKVISLEDFVQAEIKARLSTLPDEDTGEESEARYKGMYSAAQKIEDAYRDGNLDMLDSLSKLMSSKNTQKFLINDRNIFFVNTIDSVLKTKSIFGGVGAAHLPGEDGVIELLRKKGYTVEPVIPRITKKSDEIRDQLDAQTKPVTFTRQYISDSAFSLAVPGKLSQIVDLENIKYYIHADMVNGSFYTVIRLKYFGPLSNISALQMQMKVDSMLYEYIPGKIIFKKELSASGGIRGIELVNKTRRGDEQHYQIYFTDLEMILFKLGGKQQYASGNEAKTFFNSIQFHGKSENLVEFSPKTKGFSIKIPANYSYVKNSGSSVKGLVEDLYGWQKTNKQFYGMKHAVYNDFDYLEEDTFELNQFAANVLRNYRYNSAVKKELLTWNGLPALRFSGKNSSGGNFYGQLVIKGVHYYLVYLISEAEQNFTNDFFSSFRLMDFHHVNPLKEITDREFFFKATDEVSESSLSRFNETFSKAYEEVKVNKPDTEEKKGFDFDYRSATKMYYSPSSNEYINIVYEKFNDYDYRDEKELQETLLKNVRQINSLEPTRVRVSNNDGVYTLRCTLRDTATSRAIEFKMLVKGGIRYELSIPYDTTVGIKGWARHFFETFRLTDTVVGKDLFQNKFATLLNDLVSADTAVRRKANTSVQNSVAMQKAFLDDFLRFLGDTQKLAKVHEDSKAQLFVNGGTVESEKIIEPYKKLYKHYADSFYMQLCLLKGLAYLKTQNSYNTFYALLTSEVPLVGSADVVNDVFNILHDSLELCKKFYPGLLSLTRYDEYRTPVYALLANLVSRGLVNPNAYLAQKSSILADATLALKRYTPNSKTQTSDYNEYLDKVSKELAASLQASMEGFSNNNNAKFSSYARNSDALNRHELVNYAVILSSFYNNDEKVKAFFAKLSKVRAQSIAMPVFVRLLKQNIVLNDTLLEHYCRNKTTRAYFYTELEKEKMADRFVKKYLNQESLVESVLSTQKQLAGIYSYEKDKKQKDSLVFLTRIPAKNKLQKGEIYIFRIQRGRFDDEQWALAFVPASKTALNTNIEVVNLSYQPEKAKSQEENINEVLNDFYLSYRKRASAFGNSLIAAGGYD